jgi:hypothetical protein
MATRGHMTHPIVIEKKFPKGFVLHIHVSVGHAMEVKKVS